MQSDGGIMKIIGLTGGVGSGKSTVADIIVKHFPASAIFTDDIARKQMEPGGISYSLVLQEFGAGILDEQKAIDRKKLASIVFQDEKLLKRLNELTHPQVLKVVMQMIETLEASKKYEFVLVETALLKEAGYDTFCDEIWYVYAEETERRTRLKASRGYSEEKIDDVFLRQKSDSEFRSYCTRVIYNGADTTEEDIIRQIHTFLE